jgi:ATP-binding cassette, subfamily B, bacterial PglK
MTFDVKSLINKSSALLTLSEKTRLLALLCGLLLVGLVHVVGIGSIVPLLGLLSDPDANQSLDIIEFLRNYYDFASTESVIIFLAFVSFAAIVISNVLSAFTSWYMFRFVWRVQSRLSTDLLSRYMAFSYESTMNRNSADAEKNVLVEAHIFTNGVMLPAIRMLSSAIIVVFVAGFLIAYDPVLAVIATSVLGLGYLGSFILVRRKLARAGMRRAEANRQRFKAVNEAIGGVKELQILGRTEDFVDRYRKPADVYARSSSFQQIMADVPRYAIEILAFGSVMLAAVYVGASTGNLRTIAPVLGVYLVAGYRLMPAMQKVYNDWSLLRFHRAVIGVLHGDYSTEDTVHTNDDRLRSDVLPFTHEIRVNDLSYTYPGGEQSVIAGLDLVIQQGQTISLIGETGSGKTTIAEILIGILKPSSGSVEIDGTVLDSRNTREWQNSIGYVPQDTFLIDDTITANVALGVPQNEVDFSAVQNAGRIANIHDFIMSELPDKYETLVGDHGIRLSGGQRQRIGIARALYHNPSVLFLDEATSNLDQETEQSLHKSLEQLSGTMTIVLIAHRLIVTRSSDVIFVIRDGEIVAKGVYNELIDASGKLRDEFSYSTLI